MTDLICNIPTPRTPQELEQAIQRYRTSDLSRDELFCQWQAIRNASLAQTGPDSTYDQVAGEDSY